jgi:hypothetical protein
MIFAASIYKPQMVWGSVPFDYGNFNYSTAVSYDITQLKDAALWANATVPETVTTTETSVVYGDGDAFSFEIASKQNDAIMWIIGADALIIGTSCSEWVVGPDITALNISPRRRSGIGSAAIQAEIFGDSPVFVQGTATRGGLREYAYLSASAELASPDLTFPAEQMLDDGAVQMDFAQMPQPTMNVVTADGLISALLYNKPYNVIAWHRLKTAAGLFKSVAVVGGTNVDAVYVITERPAAAGTHCIERFNELWDASATAYQLDSWEAHSIAAQPSAAVFGRFASQLVYIKNLTDGTLHTVTVSAGGTITWPTGDGIGDSVIVGLPITCTMKTMRIMTQTRTGEPGVGKLKRVTGVTARVLESLPFKVSTDNGTTYEWASRPDEAAWTAAYTGDVPVVVPPDWNREGWVYLIQDLPQRTTILALVLEIDS